MIIFRELPASLYRKLDNPRAASIAHMKQSRAATMTWGIEARNPPTLPACIHIYISSIALNTKYMSSLKEMEGK